MAMATDGVEDTVIITAGLAAVTLAGSILIITTTTGDSCVEYRKERWRSRAFLYLQEDD